METSMSGNSDTSSGVIVTKERTVWRIENPFSLKVGQVFTGFGIGCGIGIGVGRPLNLGAVPMLNQVMSATRGATDAFSGVGRHVNSYLRKFGAKNIEAGIGCGVGFGHGFGVGLAVKPGVIHQVQSCLVQVLTDVMMRLGMAPSLPLSQSIVPPSLQSGMQISNQSSDKSLADSFEQLSAMVPKNKSEGMHKDPNMRGIPSRHTPEPIRNSSQVTYSSRTEKVISNFTEDLLKDQGGEHNGLAKHLQSENNLLQMVLKHQMVIEELMHENEKLRQILLEDLKIPESKLQGSYPSRSKSPCTECFECRRKLRKR